MVTNIYYKLMGIIHLGAGNDGEKFAGPENTKKSKPYPGFLQGVRLLLYYPHEIPDTLLVILHAGSRRSRFPKSLFAYQEMVNHRQDAMGGNHSG